MSSKRANRPLPATREKHCRICATAFVYPSRGVNATRFLCADCQSLPATVRAAFTRMARRIELLERALNASQTPPPQDPSP